MLNDQLLKLEKYHPIVNYLDGITNGTGIKGWHCLLERGNGMLHVFGATTPQIAVNVAEELLNKGKKGYYKVDIDGEAKEFDFN